MVMFSGAMGLVTHRVRLQHQDRRLYVFTFYIMFAKRQLLINDDHPCIKTVVSLQKMPGTNEYSDGLDTSRLERRDGNHA